MSGSSLLVSEWFCDLVRMSLPFDLEVWPFGLSILESIARLQVGNIAKVSASTSEVTRKLITLSILNVAIALQVGLSRASRVSSQLKHTPICCKRKVFSSPTSFLFDVSKIPKGLSNIGRACLIEQSAASTQTIPPDWLRQSLPC